jgi:hypothetical protein
VADASLSRICRLTYDASANAPAFARATAPLALDDWAETLMSWLSGIGVAARPPDTAEAFSALRIRLVSCVTAAELMARL